MPQCGRRQSGIEDITSSLMAVISFLSFYVVLSSSSLLWVS
jgi:hypothetical protein